MNTPSSLEPKSIVLPGRTRLEYVEQGNSEGFPVVFLHGVTDSWRSFERVLPLLPSSVHAFAVDPGRGAYILAFMTTVLTVSFGIFMVKGR